MVKSDGQSFEDFYENGFRRVLTAAWLVSGDREVALDATQEAFKRAFVKWKRLRKTPWALGWVITTATNQCRRHFRNLATRRRVLGAAATSGAEAPPTSDRLDVLAAVQALPFRQRQAVVLYYLQDLPIAAVADLMQLSEGSVKSHLAQARERLRTRLEVTNV